MHLQFFNGDVTAAFRQDPDARTGDVAMTPVAGNRQRFAGPSLSGVTLAEHDFPGKCPAADINPECGGTVAVVSATEVRDGYGDAERPDLIVPVAVKRGCVRTNIEPRRFVASPEDRPAVCAADRVGPVPAVSGVGGEVP